MLSHTIHADLSGNAGKTSGSVPLVNINPFTMSKNQDRLERQSQTVFFRLEFHFMRGSVTLALPFVVRAAPSQSLGAT